MEFKSLGNKSKQVAKKPKADAPFNVALRLERIELGGSDKPGLFHGFDATTQEPVTVRMMTIAEGVAANKRVNEDEETCKNRIRGIYVGEGEKHRPRPSEIASSTHKTHCEPGGLLMFTKCMRNDDGTIRAHWVETLERSPGAGCDKAMANVRIEDVRDPKDRKTVIGTQVVIDVVSPEKAVVLNKENAAEALLAAFNNRNGEEKLKPFAMVRLISTETGAIVLPPSRASAHYVKVARKDPETGEDFEAREAGTAQESVTALMSPENTSQDGLIIRAALHGLGEIDRTNIYPDYAGINNDEVKNELNQITDAVRSGQLNVELVPGERISAGPATRASIIKSVKSNPRNPMNSLYCKRDDNGFTTERYFAETYITTKMGKDGHRLFTKAVPVECFPKGLTMQKLATVNDHKGLAAANQVRAAASNPAEVETPDDLPFDPSALDKDVDDFDAALANSTAALMAEM